MHARKFLILLCHIHRQWLMYPHMCICGIWMHMVQTWGIHWERNIFTFSLTLGGQRESFGLFLLLGATMLVPYLVYLEPLSAGMISIKWEMCGGNQTFVVANNPESQQIVGYRTQEARNDQETFLSLANGGMLKKLWVCCSLVGDKIKYMLGILVSATRFPTSGQQETWALKSESGSEKTCFSSCCDFRDRKRISQKDTKGKHKIANDGQMNGRRCRPKEKEGGDRYSNASHEGTDTHRYDSLRDGMHQSSSERIEKGGNTRSTWPRLNVRSLLWLKSPWIGTSSRMPGFSNFVSLYT